MKDDIYWISVPERDAAKAYCLQYFELKAQYLTMDGRKGQSYDGDGVHSGVSDPTERTAVKRAALARKIAIIEDAARFASPTWWTLILLYISDPKTDFKKLQEKGFSLNRNHLSLFARKAYWYVSMRI